MRKLSFAGHSLSPPLPYSELLARHVEDHRRLFRRVAIRLGAEEGGGEGAPVDVRLRRVQEGGDDSGLAALYFQYGRYLLMASSQPGGLPANLQGIWNDDVRPAWNCDYHLNINLQMNYWPAEVAALPECHLPLLDFIQTLREPGRRTARAYYGAGGWVVHTITNVWGFTAPGEHPSWGLFAAAGAWHGLAPVLAAGGAPPSARTAVSSGHRAGAGADAGPYRQRDPGAEQDRRVRLVDDQQPRSQRVSDQRRPEHDLPAQEQQGHEAAHAPGALCAHAPCRRGGGEREHGHGDGAHPMRPLRHDGSGQHRHQAPVAQRPAVAAEAGAGPHDHGAQDHRDERRGRGRPSQSGEPQQPLQLARRVFGDGLRR